MNIVTFLFVGLIAGFLAAKLVEGHGLGVIGDIVIGVVGAFVGGVIFTSTDYEAANFWGATGTATLGAVVLLLVGNLIHLGIRPRRKIRKL